MSSGDGIAADRLCTIITGAQPSGVAARFAIRARNPRVRGSAPGPGWKRRSPGPTLRPATDITIGSMFRPSTSVTTTGGRSDTQRSPHWVKAISDGRQGAAPVGQRVNQPPLRPTAGQYAVVHQPPQPVSQDVLREAEALLELAKPPDPDQRRDCGHGRRGASRSHQGRLRSDQRPRRRRRYRRPGCDRRPSRRHRLPVDRIAGASIGLGSLLFLPISLRIAWTPAST